MCVCVCTCARHSVYNLVSECLWLIVTLVDILWYVPIYSFDVCGLDECVVFGCRTKYNLNALSHDTAISLIEKVLADGVKLTEVNTHTHTPSHTHTLTPSHTHM